MGVTDISFTGDTRPWKEAFSALDIPASATCASADTPSFGSGVAGFLSERGGAASLLVELRGIRQMRGGEAACTALDQSGSVPCALHRDVMAGEDGQGIANGSVVLLQAVSCFTNDNGGKHLVVTGRNIVQVFSSKTYRFVGGRRITVGGNGEDAGLPLPHLRIGPQSQERLQLPQPEKSTQREGTDPPVMQQYNSTEQPNNNFHRQDNQHDEHQAKKRRQEEPRHSPNRDNELDELLRGLEDDGDDEYDI